MKRFGFHADVCAIAKDVMAAADYFAMNQLPELYAGTQRDDMNFPVQYIGANVPQGWAAGAVFSLLQALIGFQPDAPNGRLYLDPSLPEWMPILSLRDLRVGALTLDLRFEREGDTTHVEVVKGPRDAVVRRSMQDWARDLRGDETADQS